MAFQKQDPTRNPYLMAPQDPGAAGPQTPGVQSPGAPVTPPAAPTAAPGGGGAPFTQGDDLRQLVTQALQNPETGAFYVQQLQKAGINVTEDQVRAWLRGDLQVDDATLSRIHQVISQSGPPSPTGPLAPVGVGMSQVGQALTDPIENLRQQRAAAMGYAGQAAGLPGIEEFLGSETGQSIYDALYSQGSNAVNEQYENVFGFIPGHSPSDANGNPYFTRTGTLYDSVANRGGSRAMAGPYAAMASEAMDHYNQAMQQASDQATQQTMQFGLQGRGQDISRFLGAGSLVGGLPTGGDFGLGLGGLMQQQYFGQEDLDLRRQQWEWQMAHAGGSGGGGGGGGGGGSSSGGGPLRLPNPYAGAGSSGPSGGAIAGAAIGALAPAIPGIIGAIWPNQPSQSPQQPINQAPPPPIESPMNTPDPAPTWGGGYAEQNRRFNG